MACETHCCHSKAAEDRGIPPLGRKLKIVGGIFLLLLALSFIPQLGALNDSLLDYLQIVWWAVLLGLVLGLPLALARIDLLELLLGTCELLGNDSTGTGR